MYNNSPNNTAINRPLLSWDRPLQDAGWRRWFDTLIGQGVDRIGGVAGQQGGPRTQSLAIDTLLGGTPFTGAVDPSWTDARGMAEAKRKTAVPRESHEQFMKRYGR